MRLWLLAIPLLWISTHASADGITAELALFSMQDSDSRTYYTPDVPLTVITKTAYTFTALGFCYRMDWACIGLKYVQGSMEHGAKNKPSGAKSSLTDTYSGPGLTLGASVDGWVAHATFLIDAQKKTVTRRNADGNNTSDVSRYRATAAGLLDLGYGFKVGSVRIGPLVSLLHLEYKKRTLNGFSETLPSKWSNDFIVPHVALWMDF